MIKKLFFTLLIATLSFSLYAQQSALDHMNDLTASMENLKKDTWGYLQAVTTGKKAKTVEKKRISLVNAYRQEERRINPLKESNLKTAVSTYLNLSITVLEEDFEKILDMEEIAEQSFDDMEAYMMAREQATNKLNMAANDMIAAQNVYAADNDIELIDEGGDELDDKIEKASNALVYYNNVYLIFFKPHKQESYALDAINNNDLAALDQNISSLESFSNESLNKLKTLGNYESYSGLRISTDKLLKFFLKEAKESFPIASEFFLAQEEYEKVSNLIDSKKEKDLTQDDIDNYNEATEKYNQAVTNYNSVTERLNDERIRLTENWNLAIEKYFSLYAK